MSHGDHPLHCVTYTEHPSSKWLPRQYTDASEIHSPNDPRRSPRYHNARASENLPELWPEMTKASRFPVSHIPPLSSTISLEHFARVKCHVIWSWVVSLQHPLSPNTHSHSHTHSQTCTHIHTLTQAYTHTFTHAFMSVHTQAHTHVLSFFPSTSHSVSN